MRKFLTLFSVLLLLYSAKAQDIHYSMYYLSPMTLNPALSGKFDGTYRIGGIYRTQWGQIVPVKPLFRTPSLSFDVGFFKGINDGKNVLGLGVLLLNDQANGSSFKTMRGQLSLSYIRSFGANNNSQLSLGVQGGYTSLTLDPTNLQFADGFVSPGGAYVLSGETFGNTKQALIDVNAGLDFSQKIGDKVAVNVGYTLANAMSPGIQFSGTGAGGKLPMRHTANLGAQIDASSKFTIQPGVLYQMQAKSTEINFGSNFGYHFVNNGPNDKLTGYLGAWYRVGDAVIPTIQAEYKGIRFGVAYDVVLSKLRTVKDALNSPKGNGPTAFEIGLWYIGRTSVLKEDNYLFNPRF